MSRQSPHHPRFVEALVCKCQNVAASNRENMEAPLWILFRVESHSKEQVMFRLEITSIDQKFLVSLLFFGLLIFGAARLWSQQQVAGVKGSSIELSVGSDSGVRPDMTGRVLSTEVVAGSVENFEVATFVVMYVERSRCTARVTELGEGWELSPGMAVEFDQPLLQPTKNTSTVVIRSNVGGDTAYIDGRILGATPQSIEVAPGRHEIRVEKLGYSTYETTIMSAVSEASTVTAHLQRLGSDPLALARSADQAFEAMEWGKAVSLYSQLLKIVPGDEIAARRRAQAEGMAREERENLALKEQIERELPHAGYYLQQAGEAYRGRNFEDAANYYKRVADVSPRYFQALNKYHLSRARALVEARDLIEAERAVKSISADGLPSELEKDWQGLVAQIEEFKISEERRLRDEQEANRPRKLYITVKIDQKLGTLVRAAAKGRGIGAFGHSVYLDGKLVGEFTTPTGDYVGNELVYSGEVSPGIHRISYVAGSTKEYGTVNVKDDPTSVVINRRVLATVARGLVENSTTFQVQ